MFSCSQLFHYVFEGATVDVVHSWNNHRRDGNVDAKFIICSFAILLFTTFLLFSFQLFSIAQFFYPLCPREFRWKYNQQEYVEQLQWKKLYWRELKIDIIKRNFIHTSDIDVREQFCSMNATTHQATVQQVTHPPHTSL